MDNPWKVLAYGYLAVGFGLVPVLTHATTGGNAAKAAVATATFLIAGGLALLGVLAHALVKSTRGHRPRRSSP
jgi:hypothetical protein